MAISNGWAANSRSARTHDGAEKVSSRYIEQDRPSLLYARPGYLAKLDVCYVSCETWCLWIIRLREIRKQDDECLGAICGKLARLYSGLDRPSIAPERLLRALLLQMLYGICSERLLMEQLQYNFLFRWFIGPNLEDRVWDAIVFREPGSVVGRGCSALVLPSGVGTDAATRLAER